MASTAPPLLMADCVTVGTLMNSSVSAASPAKWGITCLLHMVVVRVTGVTWGETSGDSLCYSVHSSRHAQLSKHTRSHYPVTLLEIGEDRDSGDMTPILLIGN